MATVEDASSGQFSDASEDTKVAQISNDESRKTPPDEEKDEESPSSNTPTSGHADDLTYAKRIRDVFTNFWMLGLVAFGGPQAHIALLHERFVLRSKWVDEETFLELFGVCGALPGPTSTQLVIALATVHAGILGGLLAFVMWSFPGFVILTVAGVTSKLFFDPAQGTPDWMAGLAPAATSLVFIAAFTLSKQILSSKLKVFLAVLTTVGTLLVTGDPRVEARWASLSFPAFLLGCGIIALIDVRVGGPERLKVYFTAPAEDEADELARRHDTMKRRISTPRYFAIFMLVVWIVILVVFVVMRGDDLLNMMGVLFEAMYRTGSIIYGGGQVVLPLMLVEGFTSDAQFFQGFALVQALPGPLFNFSAFLGAANQGVAGAFVAIVGINLPGMVLTFAALPFWSRLRRNAQFKVFITGVSASAIGLVYTACVQLAFLSVKKNADAVVFVSTLAGVAFYQAPAPLGIIAGGILGIILSPMAAGLGQKPFYTVPPPVIVFVNNGTCNGTVV